jgi:hypothetical protein
MLGVLCSRRLTFVSLFLHRDATLWRETVEYLRAHHDGDCLFRAPQLMFRHSARILQPDTHSHHVTRPFALTLLLRFGWYPPLCSTSFQLQKQSYTSKVSSRN